MLPEPELTARAEALNARFRHHSATSVMEVALTAPELGKTALVSSFGAESVVLLHMLSVIDRRTHVVFIDTEMLFAETLTYQLDLSERLRLEGVEVIRAGRSDIFQRDNENLLHLHDPDACCHLRKTEPLQKALARFDSWVTGRKRYQGGTRAVLDFFEVEPGKGRIKVNPLAHWDRVDVADYISENRLPRHPLVSRGFPSIGCAPCTTRVDDGEEPRAGRWRELDKTECGIHFAGGRSVRSPAFASQTG